MEPHAGATPAPQPPTEPATTAPVHEDTVRDGRPRLDAFRPTCDGSPDIDPHLLDPDAVKVLARLRQHDFEAYLVGGCVRDLLLGRAPKDFDIATSASPDEVRGTFRNCRLIGRRFRLAHVYFKGGKICEVSTFRANPSEMIEERSEEDTAADTETEHDHFAEASDPESARDPQQDSAAPANGPEEEDLLITEDNVFGTAEQDARRRDFTINGLFYDPFSGRVIDYVRGTRDLRLRQIRTIGDPEIRLREDPVRLLRAVRFSCKLALDIEPRTYAAMEGAVEDLPRCSPPRLLEETFRLIRGGIAAPSLRLLRALDGLRLLMPPLDEFVREHGDDAFFPFAEALDRRVAESRSHLDDALLLAALLLPLSRSDQPADASDEARPSVSRATEALLAEFVRTARLPRRIAERCRMLLFSQRLLTGERRKKGGQASFRAHPLFHDALWVFQIYVDATGQFGPELARWLEGGAPEVRSDAEGPRRRRRRRRRGQGGGRAGELGAGAPGSGPAEDG